ncbi:hypothetical protein Patl1_17588 [Pistacia atlantica]|uniref:Uncharacterized protein n=1 Tax=Pistacia atlantica TaxID=434234 RepID=A0ACC1C215_9ROSI|nr:hypothetical protein Patl1_17588 [Pistacia atlantica]
MDSGASTHITNNLSNLSLKSEYQGPKKMTMGNGQALNITHYGKGFINSSCSTPILLKNILVVPKITKNLLSVSQVTTDNNLCVLFHGKYCSIKDKKGKILLEGVAEGGLYKLNHHTRTRLQNSKEKRTSAITFSFPRS